MKTILISLAACLLLTPGQAKPKPESPAICMHRGALYTAGETFKDSCNTCTCGEDGEVSCTKMLCAPCLYAGPDGNTKMAYDGTTFNDGCNTCGCVNGEVAFCTYMYCGGWKCEITNNDGHKGWVDVGTVIIKDAEEEGGNPQVCTCKSAAPQYLGYSELQCE